MIITQDTLLGDRSTKTNSNVSSSLRLVAPITRETIKFVTEKKFIESHINLIRATHEPSLHYKSWWRMWKLEEWRHPVFNKSLLDQYTNRKRDKKEETKRVSKAIKQIGYLLHDCFCPSDFVKSSPPPLSHPLPLVLSVELSNLCLYPILLCLRRCSFRWQGCFVLLFSSRYFLRRYIPKTEGFYFLVIFHSLIRMLLCSSLYFGLFFDVLFIFNHCTNCTLNVM